MHDRYTKKLSRLRSLKSDAARASDAVYSIGLELNFKFSLVFIFTFSGNDNSDCNENDDYNDSCNDIVQILLNY